MSAQAQFGLCPRSDNRSRALGSRTSCFRTSYGWAPLVWIVSTPFGFSCAQTTRSACGFAAVTACSGIQFISNHIEISVTHPAPRDLRSVREAANAGTEAATPSGS